MCPVCRALSTSTTVKTKKNQLCKASTWPLSVSKNLTFYLEKYIFLKLTVLVAQWQLFRSIWSTSAALVCHPIRNSKPNLELMTVLDGQDSPPPPRWAAVHSSDVLGSCPTSLLTWAQPKRPLKLFGMRHLLKGQRRIKRSITRMSSLLRNLSSFNTRDGPRRAQKHTFM